MKVTAANYEQLRQWFAIVFEVESLGQNIPADIHPVNVLDSMTQRSPSLARKGLGMAIGDLMEGCEAWQPDIVAELDRRLSSLGLPTFSAMRFDFGRQVRGILKRGRIRNEAEYYLVRNAAETAGMPEDDIWDLIAEYEASVVPQSCYSG